MLTFQRNLSWSKLDTRIHLRFNEINLNLLFYRSRLSDFTQKLYEWKQIRKENLLIFV